MTSSARLPRAMIASTQRPHKKRRITVCPISDIEGSPKIPRSGGYRTPPILQRTIARHPPISPEKSAPARRKMNPGSTTRPSTPMPPSIARPTGPRRRFRACMCVTAPLKSCHISTRFRNHGAACPRIAFNCSRKRAERLLRPSSHRFTVDSSTPSSLARRRRDQPIARRARARRPDHDSPGSMGTYPRKVMMLGSWRTLGWARFRSQLLTEDSEQPIFVATSR